MAYESSFRTGGLASGLDSNSIIDQLSKLEARPIDMLRARQSAIKSQVSALGDMASKLSALEAAARKLGDKGALALKATSTHTAFGAAPSSSASPGRYQVGVEALASAAKSRSAEYASATDLVMAGNLHIATGSGSWDVKLGNPATGAPAALSDVAFAINQSGAPVSAVVLSDGGKAYLSVTARETGHVAGQDPASALVLEETYSGSTGVGLAMEVVAPAANAQVRVDGLLFERRGNELTDVVPGTTLSLKSRGAAEELVISEDVAGTAASVESFVSAYNDVVKLVQRHLSPSENTSRNSTLAGDPAVRSLQQGLQRLITTQVTGLSTVRTLADIGVKTGRDGTLSLDQKTLGEAIARDPTALNTLFSQASSGVATATKTLVQNQTRLETGVITSRRDGLERSMRDMDKQAERLQLRVDAFRQNLITQFASMEKVLSSLKATGNFLSQQDSLLAKAR
jgi:flagellar hook-associated protein 2